MKVFLVFLPFILLLISCNQNLYPIEIAQFGSDYYKTITQDGKATNDHVFSDVSDFHNGIAQVTDYYTGKTGFIDDKGNIVIPLEYTVCEANGYDWYELPNILVEKDEFYGVFDYKGNWLIELKYPRLERENDTIFSFSTQVDNSSTYNKVGLVTVEGKEIVPEEYYDFISESKNYLLSIKKDENGNEQYCTLYSADGTPIKNIDQSITCFYYLNNNFLFIKNNKGFGLLDTNFNEVFYTTDYEYVTGGSLIETTKVGESSSHIYYFDTQGKLLDTSMISYINDYVYYGKGLIIYDDKVTKKCGLYSIIEGKTIGNPIYNKIDSRYGFKNLIAKKGAMYGLLDINCNEITDFCYQDIKYDYSNDNILIFKKAGYYGLMDSDGKILHEAEFKEILPFKDNFAVVITKDNLKSAIDTAGVMQLAPSKIDIKSYNNGLFIFSGEESFSYGVANSKGKVVVKPYNMHGPYIYSSGLITLGYIDSDNQIYDIVFNKDGKILTKVKRGPGRKNPGFCG